MSVSCCSRGISPLLATIILVAITVSAGLVIYHLFFSLSGVAGSTASIEVVSADLIKASSKIMLSVTVKNTGSKPFVTCTVTVWGDDGFSHGPLNLKVNGQNISISNPLDPGSSASGTFLDSSIGGVDSYTIGKLYPIKVVASAADGSRIDKILTVTCRS